MVRTCIEDQHPLYGHHRLGITLHVYTDTWAHQGFAGFRHDINNVKALDDQDKPDEVDLNRNGDLGVFYYFCGI